MNTQIRQTSKELAATQKYITPEQADRVGELNSQLDHLKHQYDEALSSQMDLAKADYENQLLEVSTILKAS